MRRVSPALVLALALSSAPALADETTSSSNPPPAINFREPGALQDASPQHRQHMLSLFLGFPYGYWWFGGFPLAVSGRYYLPILHDGFVPQLNDSFAIEFGADFAAIFGTRFYPFLSIPAEATWGLHFTQNFAGYLKLGIALRLAFGQVYDRAGNLIYNGFGLGADPIAGIGIWYKFSQNLYLRVEAGYPWFKIGIGFGL